MNSPRLLQPAADARNIHWSEAVRPAEGIHLRPVTGYRPDVYINPTSGLSVPALAIAADRRVVFPLFLALIERIGSVVDVILETSHFRTDGKHRDYRRLGARRDAVASYFCEFEDLMTDDGCTGVAVISPRGPFEVQFDEHKTIVVYAPRRRPFAQICRAFGLTRRDDLLLVSEVRHIHRSHAEFAVMFRDLTRRLGMSRD